MGTPHLDTTKVRTCSAPELDIGTVTSEHKTFRMSRQRFRLTTKLRPYSNLKGSNEAKENLGPSCSRTKKSWITFPTAKRRSSPLSSETENESTSDDSDFLLIQDTDIPLTNRSPIVLDDDVTVADTPCAARGFYEDNGKQTEEYLEVAEEDIFWREERGGDEDYEDYITTCTIIRPLPRSTLRDLFTCSPPKSRRSRRLAPSDSCRFKPFGRFAPSNALRFEKGVDYLQAKRALELSGGPDLRIWVTQTQETHTEESWRHVIQKILYSNPGSSGPHTGPVFGRGD